MQNRIINQVKFGQKFYQTISPKNNCIVIVIVIGHFQDEKRSN